MGKSKSIRLILIYLLSFQSLFVSAELRNDGSDTTLFVRKEAISAENLDSDAMKIFIRSTF